MKNNVIIEVEFLKNLSGEYLMVGNEMERESSKSHRKSLLIEGSILLIFFLTIFLLLARYAGGPVNSDNLFYMDAGLNGYKSTHTLFYYFHIYLQQVFMSIARSPLTGVKLFWSFLIASTAVLIYVCGRLFTRRNSRVNAIFAVLIFFSLGFISMYSGRTENDLTAMFMVVLLTVCYLVSVRNDFRNRYLIGLIGFLIFLASRTKETASLFSIVIIGFGFSDNDHFSLRFILRKLPALFIGFLCGIVFFILLNAIFINDPFWGFRPSEILTNFSAVEAHARWGDISRNYFNDVILSAMLFPFLLFVIAGVQNRDDKIPLRERLPWFYPFLLILFFTTLMIFSSGYKIQVIDRLFLPAIPVISLFAAQVLDFRNLHSKRDWLWMSASIISGTILYFGFFTIFKSSQSVTKYQTEVFFANILMPLVISAFVISFFWKKPDRVSRLVLPVICLSIFLVASLRSNFQSFFIDQPVKHRMEQIFYPFSVFADRIQFDPTMKFFVSANINKELQLLLRRSDEVRSIFNVYFQKNAANENFITQIEYSPAGNMLQYGDPIPVIKSMEFDYALITTADWERIGQIGGLSDQLLVKYNLYFDDQKSIALLVNKLRDSSPAITP
jgi:hypothetical protein